MRVLRSQTLLARDQLGVDAQLHDVFRLRRACQLGVGDFVRVVAEVGRRVDAQEKI